MSRAGTSLALATAALAFLALAPAASASKQVVDFFGGSGTEGGQFTEARGIAINQASGDVYVTDPGSFQPSSGPGANRIERFHRDDNGTPADPTDDTYHFLSAWGAGVDAAVGGSDYQVCTVAADCQPALRSGGNGTLGGDGSLKNPYAIAVDQETGDVYVSDGGGRGEVGGYDSAGNFRVNVYTAEGAFLRSFGWGVVASGPDDNGTGYEICKAGIDVCKTGLPGSGVGQVGEGSAPNHETAEGIAVSPPDGNPASGTVFLADTANHRIDTYNLDGTSPSSFGSSANFSPEFPNFPKSVAVDSRGIVYADNGTNGNEIERYDSQGVDGPVGFLAPIAAPPLASGSTEALAVDPDTDGAGPDSDVLYVGRRTSSGAQVQQFGPLNAPGLLAPPAAADDTHATSPGLSVAGGLAVDEATGRIFATSFGLSSGAGEGSGVYVLANANATPPSGSLDSLSGITTHGLTAHATVNPNGLPNTSYRFEYSIDGSSWESTPTKVLGHQEAPQAIEEAIDPPGAGLRPNTLYHVRLVFQRRFAQPVTTSELTATTLAAPPLAETTGTPLRTTSTATLLGRVDPNDKATTYRFEYVTEAAFEATGFSDLSSGGETAPQPAGSGDQFELLSEEVTGLEPNTAYRYRLLADNGAPGSPVSGTDMGVSTRASEAPLSHGHFPGPPGSDRAYEQVSMPDAGGNPVGFTYGFSDAGDRALYSVFGGTPISTSADIFTPYFAQRIETAPHRGSWQTSLLTPPRDQQLGGGWGFPVATADLGAFVVYNNFNADSGNFWRLAPGVPPAQLFAAKAPQESTPPNVIGYFSISADASTAVAALKGPGLDPAHPAAGGAWNLYRLAPGQSPRLLSLLPSGAPPACGIDVGKPTSESTLPPQRTHWLSADGERLLFLSRGNGCLVPRQLYLRDLGAEETKLISGPPLSGPSCAPVLIDSSASAVYFWTQTRLGAADSAPAACGTGGDVYRYDIAAESLKCLTCLAPGLTTDVPSGSSDNSTETALAADASRLYFASAARLLPGAPPAGTRAVYRLDLSSGDLAYLYPLKPGQSFSPPSAPAQLSPDGRFLAFHSKEPFLNPLGGASENGGTTQDYLYDDSDGSIVCTSCPPDGAATTVEASIPVLAADGTTAFNTSTPLVGADQNTPASGKSGAGTDVYEFRDGRPLLITDGLTDWLGVEPGVIAINPSGRDIFFLASIQYTPDALDGFLRLYDARIGGGFEFPPPPPPCPLEVCQGTPKGTLEEQPPGTANFQGSGNREASAGRCPKGKVKKHARCVSRKHRGRQHRRAANRNRRAHR